MALIKFRSPLDIYSRKDRKTQKLVCTCSIICIYLLLLLCLHLVGTRGSIEFIIEDNTEPDDVQLYSFNKRLTRYPRNGTGISVDISNDFNMRLFNSFCTRTVQLRAVLPIYSAADRFQSRHLLRNSLGKLAQKLHCRIFFITGISVDKNVHAKLREEFSREQDILIVDKIDTYRDLNNKAFAMMDWISKHCTNVPYVIHLIDDTYIDLSWFLEQLDSIPEEFYMFAPMANSSVIRVFPKSFVTVEEYPFPRFPIYAYGMAYAFPSRVAARLLTTVYNATYCWIEDIWIGGHVRLSAGVNLVPIPRDDWKVLDHMTKQKYEPVSMVRVLHGVEADILSRFYRNRDTYLMAYLNSVNI